MIIFFCGMTALFLEDSDYSTAVSGGSTRVLAHFIPQKQARNIRYKTEISLSGVTGPVETTKEANMRTSETSCWRGSKPSFKGGFVESESIDNPSKLVGGPSHTRTAHCSFVQSPDGIIATDQEQGNRLLDLDVKAGLTQFGDTVNHLQSFLATQNEDDSAAWRAFGSLRIEERYSAASSWNPALVTPLSVVAVCFRTCLKFLN
jgi:hypothetical protein